MIILVGGEKGGTGKSCLSQNLSVYLQLINRDVVLIDADAQQTSTMWNKARAENPEVKAFQLTSAIGDLTDLIAELSLKHKDSVIDCGAGDSPTLRSCMLSAPHFLRTPQPNLRDTSTLGKVSQLTELAQKMNSNLYIRTVLTRCPTLPAQFPRILHAKELSKKFGIEPLNAITCNRIIYDDAEAYGLSVFEAGRDIKARYEIMEIAEEFLGVKA